MKVKQFTIHTPDQIPSRSAKPGYVDYDFSEWYPGKSETVSGDICFCVAAYDFNHKCWRILQAGTERLIEWYTEVE